MTLLIAPGPGFYMTPGKGKQEVRFSFCTNVDDIENAMIVLKRALVEYQRLFLAEKKLSKTIGLLSKRKVVFLFGKILLT